MSRVPWIISLTLLAAALPGRAPLSAATAAPAAWGVPPVVATAGSLGGEVRDMAFAGQRLWYGTGTTVSVADLSAPAQPRLLGRSPQVGGVVSALALAGNRAFAAAGPAGLVVLDTSAPDRPRVTAVLATPGPARDIALAGNRALVAAEGAGLLVVDVEAPDRPRLLGAFPTAQLAARVTATAGHAYVLTLRRYTGAGGEYYSADQIEVFDLSGALGGRPTTTFPASEMAGAPEGPLAVLGSSLLVGVGYLAVYDLARPGRPRELARLELGTLPRDIAAVPGSAQVLVAGGRGHPDSGKVVRVDLTDPAKPTVLATWLGGEAGQPTVAVSGDLFCLGQPTGGLEVASLAQQPPAGGPLQPAGTLAGLSEVLDVAARAGRVYLAAGLGGLAVATVDGAGNLAVAGQLPVGTGGVLGRYLEVALPPGSTDTPPERAYIRSEHGDIPVYAVRAIDVSDPAHPAELGALTGAKPYGALAVGERYIYAGQAEGIDVIDTADPADMKIVNSIYLYRGAGDLTLANGYLYAVSPSHLAVYELVAPEKPRQLGSVALAGTDKVLAVAGERAYVGVTPTSGGVGRLNVLDTTAAGHPTLLAAISLPGAPTTLHVAGARVLVGVRSAGSHGVDDQPQVLTLAQDAGIWPRVTGGTRPGDVPVGLTALGPRAWSAAGAAGLVPLRPGTLLSLPVLRR